MKRVLILTFFLIQQMSIAQLVPEIEWFQIYDGLGNGNDFVNDVKIDKENNIYLAGRSRGLDGSVDLVITKYSISGDSLLNIRYLTTEDAWDEVTSIEIDSNKNIYALGSSSFGTSSFYAIFIKYSSTGEILWEKDYYFDPDSASEGLRMLLDYKEEPIIGYENYTPFTTAHFTKFTANGEKVWENIIHSDTTGYRIEKMISDSLGNIYAVLLETGYTGGDVYDSKLVLVKLDENGNLIWDNSLILYNADSFGKLMFDNDKNLLFGTNEGRLIKINPNGDVLWEYDARGLLSDFTFDSKNNILLAGYTGGVNSVDYLTTKISKEGIELWSRQYNSSEDENDFFYCITSDTDDNVYVCGSTHNSIDFGLTYTLKYDQEGKLKWKHRYDMPHSIFEHPQNIILDDSSNIIIAGDYRDSTNGSNFFLMKLSQKLGTKINSNDAELYQNYFLGQNYPNPFNPSTVISYTLPSSVKRETSNVSLKVYDVLGREVTVLVDEEQSAGTYSVQFAVGKRQLTSGVYFYRLKAGSFVESRKMVLIK